MAIEKRLGGLARLSERPRLVFRFGDGTDASCEKDQIQDEKNGLIVFKMSRPRPPDDERVLRFDFGDGGQAGKTNEATDSSHPTEGEKK